MLKWLEVAEVNHQRLLRDLLRNGQWEIFWNESNPFGYDDQASLLVCVYSLRNFVPSAQWENTDGQFVDMTNSWSDRA